MTTKAVPSYRTPKAAAISIYWLPSTLICTGLHYLAKSLWAFSTPYDSPTPAVKIFPSIM